MVHNEEGNRNKTKYFSAPKLYQNQADPIEEITHKNYGSQKQKGPSKQYT